MYLPGRLQESLFQRCRLPYARALCSSSTRYVVVYSSPAGTSAAAVTLPDYFVSRLHFVEKKLPTLR
jgi:hypothetical protein